MISSSRPRVRNSERRMSQWERKPRDCFQELPKQSKTSVLVFPTEGLCPHPIPSCRYAQVGGVETEMNPPPGLPSLCCYTRASYPLQYPPKNQPRSNPGESQVALQDRNAGEQFCCPALRFRFRLTTQTLARCFVCLLTGESASLRCIMTGMASGSIVVFYNDFNRWHHEYQTRYWPSQRPGQALTGAAVARRELHTALPPSGSSHHTAPYKYFYYIWM